MKAKAGDIGVLKRNYWLIALLWTIAIVVSLFWNFHQQEERLHALAFNNLKLSFDKDVVYRLWASRHGGVYVPISDHTPPNPYLAHTEIKGEPYFRYMKPFFTEQSCLRCHGHQGYEVGDVRGGISVSAKAAPYYTHLRSRQKTLLMGHGVIWLAGIFAAGAMAFRTISMRRKGEAEQIRAEEALRKSEERYRSIITVSNTGAWEYNRETDFLWCSPEYFTMLGHDPEDYAMTGQNNLQHLWIDFLHPEDRERAPAFFTDYLNTGSKGMYEQHFRMRHKDGHWVWILSRGKTLSNPDGTLTNLTLGTHINISEKKLAEQEHNKLQSQLYQAQKMESVGRLAGGVAHDFNNKLTVINGYSEMALDMMDPSDPLRETIQEIHSAGNKSADIVRQLLAFAREQTVSPVELDLNDSISCMLKMLQRLIGENIDLIWRPGQNLWSVKIDPSQVDQIMANLAVNSRDAISDTGKITIETANIDVDEDYCRQYAYAVPGQYIMLAVSDDGCGMDKEALANLFEPFFTTKEAGKGTGLGLAMVYGIVKQNNGFINVYSESGKGTAFKIYLPRHEAEESFWKPAIESNGQVPTGTETVLIVEDEDGVLQMSRQILERLGYTVQIAGNPSEALQLSEEYDGAIHLLITDVVMPEMNGRDLASRMATNRPGLKTLYMSGYTANAIVHNGVLDEDVKFLQKPFTVKDLAEKVREAIVQEQKH